MSHQLPDSPDRFLRGALAFRDELQEFKQNHALPEGNWYPFDTLSCLHTVTELLSKDFHAVMEDVASAPVADIGCADGDFALLFARWGVEVDALDYVSNNYNRMEGVAALASALQLPVGTFDLDLDNMFQLPHELYGLTIFLGTLYHLKNPYGVLEKLAYQTRWCFLSTRIAQITPSARARIETEPVAYLADGREIANDATNYWIFSSSGLLRILQRTRWAIVATQRVGCGTDSDPIDSNADERMFLLLKSRVHFPTLQIRLLEGWHLAEHNFRWTEKRFALEVILPLERSLSGFSMPVFIPQSIITPDRTFFLSCTIRDQSVGTARYDHEGAYLFRGALPPFALHEPVLRLSFAVENNLSPPSGDVRELGICVPLTDFDQNEIGFRVFDD